MEHEPTPPPVVPSHAPPTLPTGTLAEPPPTWPKVLGILCCVFAGLGFFGRLFQIAGVVAMGHLPIDAWMKPPQHLVGILIALAVAGLLIPAVHVALGVQFLRRRPSVLALGIAFIAIVVLLHIPNSIVQWQVQQAQMQAMQQHMAEQAQQAQRSGSAAPPVMPPQFNLGAGFGVAMGIFGGLFAIAWPGFLLVWMLIPKHRAQIRGWGAAPSSA